MKRILSIQDISCLGKCSLTVALPIISAMGVETCIIPTAVLSTHTMFSGFTFKDLTDQIGIKLPAGFDNAIGKFGKFGEIGAQLGTAVTITKGIIGVIADASDSFSKSRSR